MYLSSASASWLWLCNGKLFTPCISLGLVTLFEGCDQGVPLFAVTLIGLVDFMVDGVGRSLLRANATKRADNPLGAQSDALLPQGALAFDMCF